MNVSSTNSTAIIPAGFFNRVTGQIFVDAAIGVGSFVLGSIAGSYKDKILGWCGWSRRPQTANLFRSRIKFLRTVYARGTRLADSIMARLEEEDPIGPEEGINFVIGINTTIADLNTHESAVLEHKRSVVGGRQYEELSLSEEAELLLFLGQVTLLFERFFEIRQYKLSTFNVQAQAQVDRIRIVEPIQGAVRNQPRDMPEVIELS